jgi:hypothetical protein
LVYFTSRAFNGLGGVHKVLEQPGTLGCVTDLQHREDSSMEYLLIDAHQRFLGTLRSDRTLAVGDIFQRENTKTYAVVGVAASSQRIDMGPSKASFRRQALTVVAVNRSVPQEQAQPV